MNSTSSGNLEANLYKWTNLMTGYKKRWFVLRGNILYYYVSKGEKVRGKIHLAVSEINPHHKNSVKFELDTGTTVIYIKANNSEERETWINALNLAKRKEGLNQKARSNSITNKDKDKEFDNGKTNIILDNKFFNKIVNARSFLENLTQHNELFKNLLETNNLDANTLNNILTAYKSGVSSIYLNFDEMQRVMIRFYEDLQRFTNYFEGSNMTNYLNQSPSRTPQEYNTHTVTNENRLSHLQSNHRSRFNSNNGKIEYNDEKYSNNGDRALYENNKERYSHPIDHPYDSPPTTLKQTNDKKIIHDLKPMKLEKDEHIEAHSIIQDKQNETFYGLDEFQTPYLDIISGTSEDGKQRMNSLRLNPDECNNSVRQQSKPNENQMNSIKLDIHGNMNSSNMKSTANTMNFNTNQIKPNNDDISSNTNTKKMNSEVGMHTQVEMNFFKNPQNLSSIPNMNMNSNTNSNISSSIICQKPAVSNNFKYYIPEYDNIRRKLPFDKHNTEIKFWKIFKDAIGQDLSRFSMPVYVNEPLSMLQRLAEVFQYSDILNRAAKEHNPHIRIALVAAFCVAGFNNNIYRTTKFFNPILGETYEFVDNELKFRYVAEQVSHHPAITAMHAEGESYVLYSNTNAKSKFHMNSLEFEPLGRSYVKFLDFDNEEISFSKPTAIVRNTMVGKMHVDTGGKSNITNHSNGDVMELRFFEKDKPNKGNLGEIEGELTDIDGEVQMKLKGNWLTHFDMIYTDINGKEYTETIWKTNLSTIPDDILEKRYFFSDYTINLNNQNPELLKTLPRSDCRLRPDQLALELSNLDFAAKEKLRLEEKQRAKRKLNEKKKIIHKPKYFVESYDDLSGELVYLYVNDYWKDRKDKPADHFPDLY